jgi:2-phosphosulfolactate phosphatase
MSKTNGIQVHLELGRRGAVAAGRRGGVVILIDALRASATIVTALGTGMAAVRPVRELEERVGEVTAGERGGRKLPSAKHGNSPTELLEQDYAGKTLVLATTNGVECLLTAAGPATRVMIGTTLNCSAVVAAATEEARELDVPITLLMAGRDDRPAAEDALTASLLVRSMGPEAHLHGSLPPSSLNMAAPFLASAAGQNLVELGYTDDVEWCARVDVYDVVPVLKHDHLVPRPS